MWSAHPASFIGIILMTVVQALIPIALAWITKLEFDLLAQTIKDQESIPWNQISILLLLQAIITVGQQVAILANRYLSAEFIRKLTIKIKTSVYCKVNGFKGLAYFEKPEFYDKIQLAEQGVHHAASQSLGNILAFVQNSILLISFGSVLLIFEPLLAGLLLISSLPNLLVQIKMGRLRYSVAAEINPQRRYMSFYGTMLTNRFAAKEVRLFKLGDYFLKKLLNATHNVHDAERRQQKKEMNWQTGLSGFSSLVSSLAFVWVIIMAFSGRLSLGSITLYMGAVGSVQSGLMNLLLTIAQMNESILFYTHFNELNSMPPALSTNDSVSEVSMLKSGIEFMNVSFRYNEQQPWILRNVNLFIPKGQCLALVGLNGAGKTTLVKLLTRLYDPTEGVILWDGVDIRQFEIDELRQRIGVIFQDFVAYDLTAQENVGLGDVTHVDDLLLVQQAAKQVGIHEMIKGMPNGYKTPLGFMFTGQGEGTDLSGGQWQKIATARLFMRREADLLILDEPTAALDAAAEYESYRHFSELINDRTSILISHRFSTVRMADIIAVLENGYISECGSHDELLSQEGTYAKLYRLQAERYQASYP